MRVLLLLLLLTVTLTRVGLAQTPGDGGVDRAYASAEIVAQATVLTVAPDSFVIDGVPIGSHKVTLQLTRRWKGAGPDTVVAKFTRGVHRHGTFPLVRGAEVLAYLSYHDGFLWLGNCSRDMREVHKEPNVVGSCPPLPAY